MIPNRTWLITSFQSSLLNIPCNISKRSPSPDTITMSVHFLVNSSSPHTRSLAWLRLEVTTTSYRVEDWSRSGATVFSNMDRAFPGPLLGLISISKRRALLKRDACHHWRYNSRIALLEQRSTEVKCGALCDAPFDESRNKASRISGGIICIIAWRPLHFQLCAS